MPISLSRNWQHTLHLRATTRPRAAVSSSYLSQVDVDSALSLSAIHLSTIDFVRVRLRFLAEQEGIPSCWTQRASYGRTFCPANMTLARPSAVIDRKLLSVQPLSRALGVYVVCVLCVWKVLFHLSYEITVHCCFHCNHKLPPSLPPPQTSHLQYMNILVTVIICETVTIQYVRPYTETFSQVKHFMKIH